MPFVRGYLEFVDQAGGGEPPQIWRPEFPTNPIVVPPGGNYPSQPPSGGHPSHPWVPPTGHPSHPWVPPTGHPEHPWIPPAGHPSHPWVPPAGHPSHPIVNYPSHPIVLPPGEQPPEPGNGLSPTHPIVIPPSTEGEGGSQKALVYAIVPGVGGVWFLIETPVPPPPTDPQPKG